MSTSILNPAPDVGNKGESGVLPGSGRLRAGSVPYLNAAPLVWGLEGRLRLLAPSDLAPALRAGEIDAALLSITAALLSEDYDILDGPCVAAEGDVFSVFLAHRRPLAEARVIHCHAASLASINLLRVLFAERGLHPEFRSMPDVADASKHDFVLLIGDPAMRYRLQAGCPPVWDLGRAWTEWTGLPFVFAAWILRRDADTTRLRKELRAAAERGQRELESVIRESEGFEEAFRRTYLTRYTRHWMGDREKAGIAKFAGLLRSRLGVPAFEPRFVT